MKAAIKEKIDTLLTKKIANSAKHSQCNRANLISLKKLKSKDSTTNESKEEVDF